MNIVYALMRRGRTLYGYDGVGAVSYSRKRTTEEKEREAVKRRARQLAFQAHRRGAPIPANAQYRDEARRQLQAPAPIVLALPAGIGAKMALLEANGLTQEAGVRLCNAKTVALEDGSQRRFEAIAPQGGVRGLASGATHAVVVHAGGALAGLALLCTASGASRRAASLRNSHFFDEGGGRIDTDAALRLIRAGDDAPVNELLLLCGATHGAAMLRAAIAVFGGPSDALLFTNAAYEPRARDHLWAKVYRDKLGFHRVAGLRVSADGDEEIPMATTLEALSDRLG